MRFTSGRLDAFAAGEAEEDEDVADEDAGAGVGGLGDGDDDDDAAASAGGAENGSTMVMVGVGVGAGRVACTVIDGRMRMPAEEEANGAVDGWTIIGTLLMTGELEREP